MKRCIVCICLILPLFCISQYRMARTKGAVCYMEYGLGDDRLGGAKMGYLDSNVLLRIVDSAGNDYKIQLSLQHHAYVPKSFCSFTDQQPRRYYLSSGFRVFGDSMYDHVTIALDEKLPYKTLHTIDPNSIVLDIFGVTSNTNWITQLRSAREIGSTWYEQVEDDVMRVHIQLRGGKHWGHQLSYDPVLNRLQVRIKRPPPRDLRKWRIAIDAGHGGTNTGAAGVATGALEKDQTLLMALELQKTLRKAGVRDIFMTRDKDTTLSMEERILMLRQADPTLLLSIHLNSSSADSISGTSTFYRYVGFRPLSQAILFRLMELGLGEFGNVGSFNFALSGPTEYPNCLVEVAFLSNRADEKRIVDPRFHKMVAKKILEGLRDFSKQGL